MDLTNPQILVALLNGLPTATVALIAAGIALFQYRVTHAKFNLDLFERRYGIFSATSELLTKMTKRQILQEDLDAFAKSTTTTQFFFEADIVDFVAEVNAQAQSLQFFQSQHERLKREAGTSIERFPQILEKTIWAETKLSHHRDRFKPYLDFTKWR